MNRVFLLLIPCLMGLALSACSPSAETSSAAVESLSPGSASAPEELSSAPAPSTAVSEGASSEERGSVFSSHAADSEDGGSAAQREPAAREVAESLPEWGLTLTVTQAGPTGAAYVWEQDGTPLDRSPFTNEQYELERLEDGEWVPLPYQTDRIVWGAAANFLPLNGSSTREVDWEWLYGSLGPGEYRLVTGVILPRGEGEAEGAWIGARFAIE